MGNSSSSSTTARSSSSNDIDATARPKGAPTNFPVSSGANAAATQQARVNNENAEAVVTTTTTTPPPRFPKRETFEEKLYRKFTKEPLVPIGCAVTTYFLVAGIQSFRNRNPIKSQQMMKGRVASQFLTILAFMGYMGYSTFDFRLAPFSQDAKKSAEKQQAQQASFPAAAAAQSGKE